MKKAYITFFIVVVSIFLGVAMQAQELPKFINISENRTEVITASREVSGFYNESKLRKIYLEFEDLNYWSKLEAYYDTENYVKATLIYEGDTLYEVGVQFKGNTSYKRLDDAAEKRSFSIKTDMFFEDQDIDGYSNLNLNNAFKDNSTMREVVYAHLCRNHIPAPQANFVELYINGQHWGPYANVQQVNKDMLEEWFLSNDGARFRADGASSTGGGTTGGGGGQGGGGANWGDGTAAINYLGTDSLEYQKYYTLKSSDIDSSWQKLIKLCDVLNNTPVNSLEATLPDYLDIDRTLWFLAHEIIYSDDDSYSFKGKQDYYVYYEPETGRFTPLEFDGNSALGTKNVNWDIFMNADNANYPLLNRLLSIPTIRQRYLAHVRTILEEEMNLNEIHDLIDTYASLIDASVNADPKKLMTYQAYLSGVTELKNYFTNRKAFLLNDSEINVAGVELTDVAYHSNGEEYTFPFGEEEMTITVNVGSKNVVEVNLYYAIDFVGNFTKVQMKDDGNHHDGASGDGIYGAEIPGQTEGNYVRYYMEAIADDATKTASYLPSGNEHSSFIYRVQFSGMSDPDFVINEVLASNKNAAADELGESADFIELYNRSDKNISLAGYFLTDNIEVLDKFDLPAVILDAGAYYLVWADGDEEQGDNHANFKLNADGEDLYLTNSLGEIVDAQSFSNQRADISYGRWPNGTGDFAFMLPTPLAENTEPNEEDLIEVVTDLRPENIQESRIYPNPASDVFTIIIGNYSSHNIEVYTAVGQKIMSTQVTGEVIELNASHWREGLYLIRINDQVLTLLVK